MAAYFQVTRSFNCDNILTQHHELRVNGLVLYSRTGQYNRDFVTGMMLQSATTLLYNHNITGRSVIYHNVL